MTNHFDLVARDWDKNQMHLQRTEAIANELFKIIPAENNLKALEFGAGTGLLSFALLNYFSEIILMDSSLEMINTAKQKIAKTKIDHLHPVFFDLEKNEYTEKTFDYIFSQMALHHVDDIEKIFIKFFKLLNPDGQLAIADLYKEDGTFHEDNFTGHNGFDPDNLVKLLEKTGYYEISYKQCFIIRKLDINWAEKKFPIFLLTAKKIIDF
jgi:tRNA (cmo5U34)-methyltransferase